MMGWPGRAQSQERGLSAQAAQAAMVAPAAEAGKPEIKALNHTGKPDMRAAFERLHITHARINVPN